MTDPGQRPPPGNGPEAALVDAITAVAAHRVRRVPLPALAAAAASVDRSAAAAPGWRARVRFALEVLRDDGRVDWPTSRFDRSALPPLPAYVIRPTPPRPALHIRSPEPGAPRL